MPRIVCDCKDARAYVDDPWHAFSCQKERATSITDAHDSIKYKLASWATALGARVKVEPRRLGEDGKRPDLDIELGGSRWLLDVTRRHALAPSHLAKAAQGPLKVLEEAEQDKHRKFDVMAGENGASFVPFAVETTGGFGKEAVQWIADFIKTAERVKVVWAPREEVQGIYRTIAVAIANDNARVVKANLESGVWQGL